MTAARPKAKSRSSRTFSKVEQNDITLAQAVALDEDAPLGRLVAGFAELGDQPPLRILCASTIAAGIAGQDRALFRTGLRMVLAHSLATAGKAFVKDIVDRTRPAKAIDGGEYRLKPGKSHAHDQQSMPSGHSAGVVAVAGAAMVDYPSAALPAATAGAAIIAAQLPSRNHFLTDVLAGSAIGLASFAIARVLLPPVAQD